jgi:hypothetical protein
VPYVSITETAAEKLVALTRRTAMQLAGLSRDPDPTLVVMILIDHLHRHETLTSVRQRDGDRRRLKVEYAERVKGVAIKANDV